MINRDELMKMARDAGVTHCVIGGLFLKDVVEFRFSECSIGAFVNAILERAAVECDRNMNEGRTWKSSEDIRALKTQGE